MPGLVHRASLPSLLTVLLSPTTTPLAHHGNSACWALTKMEEPWARTVAPNHCRDLYSTGSSPSGLDVEQPLPSA